MMIRPILAMVVLTALVARADDKTSPQPGDVVLETHFASPTERQAWPPADFAKWVTALDKTTSLCITVPQESSTGSHMVSVPLDLARFRGCRMAGVSSTVATRRTICRPANRTPARQSF